MNLDYNDIIILIAIITILSIFIYFFIKNDKNIEEEEIIVYTKSINKIIPKFSNDYKKLPEQQLIPPENYNKWYINDVIPAKINNNITYEYAKQFPENISIPIDSNSIGFCPDAKEEKKALPFANINVNVLLSNFQQ